MARSELDTTHSGGEQVSSEGSDSESEPENTPPPPPPPPPSSRKTLATPNASSESDAGKADPNIKPLASKPMDDKPLKKSRSKNPTSRYSPPPLKSVTRKRPAPAPEAESESQRAKVKVVVAMAAPDNDKQKKPLIQRSWTEEEETALIKGMINYVEEKGIDPISDLNDFHVFVMNSLNFDVNIKRLADKVRRIKTKFMNNIGKFETEGNVRSISKPHEWKMYEFSKKLWGIKTNQKQRDPKSVVLDKTNQKQKDPKSVVLDKKNVNGGWLEFPITDEEIMKKGLELVSGSNKVELEERWNNLKVQQLEHFLKKLEFMQEQTKLVLNAIKKSAAN